MSDKPALTPKQMLEKTVAIYENLVGKSTRLKSKKQESSPECSSPELKTRKRRKVGQLCSESDSGSEDFEESPLRKSLSPKSPKNKKKKKCIRDTSRADSRLDSSPVIVRRYKTRTGKAKKKISYADVPEMAQSDTDFDSPKGGREDESSSNSADSSSNRKRITPRRRAARVISYSSDDTGEDSAGPSNVVTQTGRDVTVEEQGLAGEESMTSPRSSRTRSRSRNVAASSKERSTVDTETETVHTPESVPGNTDEEQEHEEDSDGSLEEMIVDRSKKETPKQLPVFYNEPVKRKRNSFFKYDTPYYHEVAEAARSWRHSDEEFVIGEETESEESSGTGKKRRAKRIISSDDESSCSKKSESEESYTGTECQGKRILSSDEDSKKSNMPNKDKMEKEKNNDEVTPKRRSNRKRPSRYSSKILKGLKKLKKSKDRGGHHDSSSSESDSTDEGSPTGGPNADDFTQRRNNGDHNPGSPRPGPSRVSENGSGDNPVSPKDDNDDLNSSKDNENDLDDRISIEVGCDTGLNDHKASFEDHREEDIEDTLTRLDEQEMNRILREGKLTELPKETSPEFYPDLLCQAAAISTPKLVGYLIEKYGYDACRRSDDGMAISYAIRAGRADNLPPLLMDMSRHPKKIVYEITKRCARDLVKGDISCLLALEEWQDQSAQGPIETTYFIEDVLKEVQGRRRVFEALGEHLNTMALEHLISLDLDTDCYDPKTALFKCLQQTDRWADEEEKCAEFVQKLIEHFGKKVLNEQKREKTPLIFSVEYDMVGAVKLLLSLGADPLVHSESEQYDTALHRAALCGHQECAEIILCQDPQTLSETDSSDWTPVMYAVYHDHWETVNLMLSINLSRSGDSTKLLQIINTLKNKRYGNDSRVAKEKNYGMIMKLIKHVAEDDKLRDSLNELVTQVNDKDLANYILEELMLYPGLVSTAVKVKYIRSRSLEYNYNRSGSIVDIPRDRILDAVLSQWRNIEGKQKIWASFKDEPASGQGPTKEFYELFSQEIVNSHLFKLNTEDGVLTFTHLLLLYKDDNAKREKFSLLYNILGQMMARAILNNRPMGLQLAEYISKFIMDEPKNVLRDYETTYKSLYNSINSINSEDFLELKIPFEQIIVDPFTGSLSTFPLKSVPNDTFAADKKGYLMLKARSLLYDFPERELEALKSGFDKVFPRKYKNLLSARELGELIGGETKLDWQDWMSNTTHHVPQSVKTDFWACVESFEDEDRRALLHFATGMSFLPLGGFSHLPGSRFTLTQAMGDQQLDSLPTAATCMNLLTLPPYSDRDSMKKYLLIAIRYGSKGFVFA
ncbi:hypothetical protein ACHWQZ_G009236 [Mnemiopsis leidyi]